MADEEAEDGDVGVVDAQAEHSSPRKDNHAWHEAGVDQVHADRYSFDKRIWVGYRAGVEGEHAMEGLDEELYVEVGALQHDKAYIVRRVGSRPESSDGSCNAGLLEQIGPCPLKLWKASLRHPLIYWQRWEMSVHARVKEESSSRSWLSCFLRTSFSANQAL